MSIGMGMSMSTSNKSASNRSTSTSSSSHSEIYTLPSEPPTVLREKGVSRCKEVDYSGEDV